MKSAPPLSFFHLCYSFKERSTNLGVTKASGIEVDSSNLKSISLLPVLGGQFLGVKMSLCRLEIHDENAAWHFYCHREDASVSLS